MKTLYIAGKFRGANGYVVYRNVQMAEAAMYEVIKGALERGTPVSVLCPHALTVHFDRTFTDQYWLEATLEWLDRCDGVLMLPDWEQSEGARGEEARARATDKRLFYNIESVLDWLQGGDAGKVVKSSGPPGGKCPPGCHDCRGGDGPCTYDV